jgi:uracil-DNA glycosylase family 4
MNLTERRDLMAKMDRGICRCRACPLHQSRTHAVPGEGPLPARIMFIGEAPGAKEDESGRPFVGPAGRFLDQSLASHGFDRSHIYLTSCVKCRPPRNRTPHEGELATCQSHWLDHQVELLDPDIIVLLGGVATRQVLGETRSLKDIQGETRTRDGRTYLLTYHPAAAMRFPAPAAGFSQAMTTLRRLAADV